MSWVAKATGNMTLSVLDDNGFQILKVDMLGAGTLSTGTNGDILARTLNDLQIIANFYENNYDISDDNLQYPEAGISPLPWSVHYDSQRRKLSVKSRNRNIADRIFPANTTEEQISVIVNCIRDGVNAINSNHD